MSSLLSKVQNALCIAGMATLIVLVLTQISGRLLPWSFPWTEEIARYVFIWTVLIGMAVAVRHGEMISLEIGYLPKKTRLSRAMTVVASLLSLVFFLAIAFLGAQQVMTQYRSGNVAYSLNLPLWVVSAAVPAAFVLATIWTIACLVRELNSGESREL